MVEKLKMALAALVAAAGIYGFYALADKALIVRLGVLLVAFGAGVAIMWLTQPGKDFVVFGRESWEEAKRVVWPTPKETLQTTGVVFVFVFVMALFLWGVDAGLLWLTHRLLGQGS
jgi:preprotein translocase subunit SecE